MGFILSFIGIPRLIMYGGLALIAFVAWEESQSVIDRYTNMSAQIERLSHNNAMLTSRLESYNL